MFSKVTAHIQAFFNGTGTFMSDVDKTIIIGEDSNQKGNEVCPVCGQELQPDWDNIELLRCPACSYTKKVITVIEPGSVVAHKYRILSYLNAGGCGSVFLCYPLAEPSTRYVLKVLSHPTLMGKKRFRREADILGTIAANGRIAKIVDYWEVKDNTYIVMEYVDGQTLKELSRSIQFDEYNILIIAYEVTRALQDIWNDFSIIHRDVKPENIMIDKDSRIKLLDFGLSKQTDNNSQTDMITVAKSALGTPGYMSPEQFTDFKNVDFRSDIYSLGATLFFLLTGHQSTNGKTLLDLYNQTLSYSPPQLESFHNSCSAECMNMICRMMQRNPEDRYSSYEELIADINTLLSRF